MHNSFFFSLYDPRALNERQRSVSAFRSRRRRDISCLYPLLARRVVFLSPYLPLFFPSLLSHISLTTVCLLPSLINDAAMTIPLDVLLFVFFNPFLPFFRSLRGIVTSRVYLTRLD